MTTANERLSSWRFWVPIALQTVLIAAIPAQAVYTHLTGKTVILQTAPVDPYDLLRGYSVTLSYDISRADNLKSLPGWRTPPKTLNSQSDVGIFVILQAPAETASARPRPWKPVAVSYNRPAVKPNQIALKGRMNNYSWVEYGLESYYIPESERQEIDDTIRETQRKQPGVVEVKVDSQGNAVPVSLWLNDRNYRF